MKNELSRLLEFIATKDGINDKTKLSKLIVAEFGLIRDRSVYYSEFFAIRFSSSNTTSFSNTVLSLSNLRKFDTKPFIVCLVTPIANRVYLANSTFLKKISHSSQQLRENNIRGSFNGSDIMREFEGIENKPENFDRLFNVHEVITFDENLIRLVEATNNISPSGRKFDVSNDSKIMILDAPLRAKSFTESSEYKLLKDDLDRRVEKFNNEILLAALIENVNVRGRVIEYLIAGKDETLRQELIAALLKNEHGIPQFKTENHLGDYSRNFEGFFTETDVKTKIMFLNSNPKAYNIDKMLEFLALPRSVFMFYFVGLDADRVVNTVLVSMFQNKLLGATILLKHWAGRNSRGVTQLEGSTIKELILYPEATIIIENSINFLEKIIGL